MKFRKEQSETRVCDSCGRVWAKDRLVFRWRIEVYEARVIRTHERSFVLHQYRKPEVNEVGLCPVCIKSSWGKNLSSMANEAGVQIP